MSKIGSNIRKIRTVKGISQSQFAELFSLNRARIGAYEEGRAEPKIDVVIEIAKYFSIPLNDIFVKDLTVNQLAHFDLIQSSPNDEGKKQPNFNQLYFLSAAQVLNKNLLEKAMETPEDLYRFSFPGATNGGNLWIELSGVKLICGEQLHPFGVIVSNKEALKSNSTVLAITKDQIYLGNYISGKSNLRMNIGGTEQEITKVNYSFSVKLLVQKSVASSLSLDQRLAQIEARISKIEG